MRGDWEELERRQGASLEGPGKFVALGVMAMVAFLAWTRTCLKFCVRGVGFTLPAQ
jgi:hypothetical protein